MRQKYFGTQFGFAGDNTVIPDPLQSGGQVSFNQGWTYDYQRDQTTDPAAKPIDRSTMNWLFGVITQQLQQYQQAAVPEWISATDNGGTPFPYEAGVRVRYSSNPGTVPFSVYVNLVANNTNTPNLADPTGATSNWQLAVYRIATSAQAAAGTDNSTIMTPSLVAQQDALRALVAGSSSQVFNVGPATAATHAVQAQQLQNQTATFAVAGGVANAYSATYTPNVTALTDGMCVSFRMPTGIDNTGASTFAAGTTSALPIYSADGVQLQGGELVGKANVTLRYNSIANSGAGAWMLENVEGGARPVVYGSKSQHALAVGQAQTNAVRYAGAAGGTVNALTATLTPAPTAYTDGMQVIVRTTGTNTGNTTLNVNGLGGRAVYGQGGALLLGGELVGNGISCFVYSSVYGGGAFLLAWTVAGGMAVGTPTQSTHAVQLGQFLSSASASGYTKLPNGIIMQWGVGSSSGTSAGNALATLPIAFPNACLRSFATVDGSSAGGYCISVARSTTQVSFTTFNSAGSISSGFTFEWFAIGN